MSENLKKRQLGSAFDDVKDGEIELRTYHPRDAVGVWSLHF